MGTVSRGSSHPVVGAPTLHPSACTPTLHLCSSGRFCASGQPPPQQHPMLFLLSMAAVSLWGQLLFSLSPHSPQLGGWFWAGNLILLYVHPALVIGPVSTVGSLGPARTGVGQAASGDL